MAKVDYDPVPTVAPETQAPDDLQHISASPNAFGAAVGQGVEALGQGALDASKFYDRVSADDATNNTLQQATSILHGDPNKMVMGPDGTMVPDTGYFGKRGADAMSAREGVSQSLDEAIQEHRESLSTPMAKYQYDVDTRRYRAQWQAQIGEYADGQQKVWATDTNTTSATLGLNAAARAPMDPVAVADAQNTVRNAYVKNAQLQFGHDPTVTQGAVLKADQDVAIARIHSSLISDPAAAQKIFDDSAPILGSRADYDQLGRQVKEASINATMSPAIDHAVSDAVSTAQGLVGQPGAAQSGGIHGAILQQESGNRSDVANSVDGAIGPGQVMPKTFAQYAKPGEVITNPADNRAVANRILDDYSQKYNGDPARVAVAYFSGPGNVAPAGSATPYLHDYKDGNGTSVSTYVSQVQGRLAGGGGSGSGTYPSTADALAAKLPEIQDKAQADAEKLFPNYPDAQERYVQGVTRRVEQTISQQHQMYEIDTHVVQGALDGPNKPVSEEALRASSPQVAAAWDRMQTENPMGAIGVRNMFDANARGAARTYGTLSKDYVDRVLAPSTDATRISNASQLWPYVGPGDDAPLTNTGAGALTSLLAARAGPQGEAFASQAKTFLDNAYGQLTFSNKGTGLRDPKGEALYSKFLAQALPQLEAANKDGTLAKRLDPKSPDYLGNVANTFARTPAQIVHDRLAGEGQPNLLSGEGGAFIQLKIAVQEGRITRQEGDWIAEKLGAPPDAAPKPGAAHPAKPAPPPEKPAGSGFLLGGYNPHPRAF